MKFDFFNKLVFSLILINLPGLSYGASSQSTDLIAVELAAYNAYVNNYNSLLAYSQSSGSTYKKNIKAALLGIDNSNLDVLNSVANSTSISNLDLPSLTAAQNYIQKTILPQLALAVNASSNASYQKYAKSGNTNVSQYTISLQTAANSLLASVNNVIQAVQQAQQVVQQAQQALILAKQIGAQALISQAQALISQIAGIESLAQANTLLASAQAVLQTAQITQQAQQKAQQFLTLAQQQANQSLTIQAQALISQIAGIQSLSQANTLLASVQAAQVNQILSLVVLYNVVINFYLDVSVLGSLSPFAPAAANYAQMATAPGGDFLPLSAAAGYNQGQMFVSFLGTYADHLWYQQLIVSLILYTLLDSTTGLNNQQLMATQFVFAALANGGSYTPISGTFVSPVTVNNLSQYLASIGLNLRGGTIPAATLNLLINVSKANWTAIYSDSTQVAALVNAFNALNISSSQFTTFFTGQTLAYATFYVNTFKALQSGANLYMNCSINPSNYQPEDSASVYYALNPSTVSSDLATQFTNFQVTNGATAATEIPFSSTGMNNMPFSYKTGTFYYMLSILSQSDATKTWNSVCSNSSSYIWYNNPKIRQIVSSMFAPNNATTSNLRMLKLQ